MALTKYVGTRIFLPSVKMWYSLDERIMLHYNAYMYYFYTGHPRDISVWYDILGRIRIFQPTGEVKICL